ncbi:50S ribosomal protein L9 [Patescibacteria group bacterium]|nr:50S ribosomal protein L9 [Patescibacteria group bacterium]
MKVILKKPVAGLGHPGEVKDVAVGYARNFLIVRGLAEMATPDKIANVEQQKARKEKDEVAVTSGWQSIVDQLPSITIKFKRKASKAGKLFAAISGEEITAALSKQLNNKIDGRYLVIEKPIKTIGEHQAQLIFTSDLQGVFKVIVEAE